MPPIAEAPATKERIRLRAAADGPLVDVCEAPHGLRAVPRCAVTKVDERRTGLTVEAPAAAIPPRRAAVRRSPEGALNIYAREGSGLDLWHVEGRQDFHQIRSGKRGGVGGHRDVEELAHGYRLRHGHCIARPQRSALPAPAQKPQASARRSPMCPRAPWLFPCSRCPP